ncbi:MAG: hypothetical protein K5639_06940, partial [Eubacterium sp.]|nr:hypothetical protein [Eubacterium sp.]
KNKVFFSYIKFAQYKEDDGSCQSEDNTIIGLCGCKSQFFYNSKDKSKGTSDLKFYDLDAKIKEKEAKNQIAYAANYMKAAKLDWYKEKILILKNIDDKNEDEAYVNERMLQCLFNLFD